MKDTLSPWLELPLSWYHVSCHLGINSSLYWCIAILPFEWPPILLVPALLCRYCPASLTLDWSWGYCQQDHCFGCPIAAVPTPLLAPSAQLPGRSSISPSFRVEGWCGTLRWKCRCCDLLLSHVPQKLRFPSSQRWLCASEYLWVRGSRCPAQVCKSASTLMGCPSPPDPRLSSLSRFPPSDLPSCC